MPGAALSAIHAALEEHFERASSRGARSEPCGASTSEPDDGMGERAHMPCVCCHVHVVGCARGIYCSE